MVCLKRLAGLISSRTRPMIVILKPTLHAFIMSLHFDIFKKRLGPRLRDKPRVSVVDWVGYMNTSGVEWSDLVNSSIFLVATAQPSPDVGGSYHDY